MKVIKYKKIIKKFGSKKMVKSWRIKKSGVEKRIVMKAVVEEGGFLEMRGKIKIGKEISGVDVFLEQRVLLLGQGARAVVIPELEIESNQVKVGHAAAVGKVDEEQLFYLMSRGLRQELAIKLLVDAFL